MSITIAAFSGSVKKESFTTKLLKAFQAQAPRGVTVNIIDISELPMINQDMEDNLPKPVKDLHKAIQSADAIILATPEYNRSYSPVIKNALDWGSRPEGKNKWKGKPAIVLGCSPYSMGAFGAVHHLRQVLVYLDMYPVQQPEFYLSNAKEKFDEAGELTDKDTQELIKKLWGVFVGKVKSKK